MSGSAPTPRAGHSSQIYGTKMYVFGGEDSRGNSNELFVLDLEQMIWTKVQNTYNRAPSARSFFASCLAPGNELRHPMIAYFGGYSDHGFEDDLIFLDLLEMRWITPMTYAYNEIFDRPTSR